MGSIQEYICEKAEKKKQTPAQWMNAAIANLPRYSLATHIGKFTHPDAKAELYDKTPPIGNGYITTTDAERKEDFVVQGGAAYMPLASFLVKKFSEKEDRKERDADLSALTAWEHLRYDTAFVRQEFRASGIDYEMVREQILAIGKSPDPNHTDRLLKQVYFPVGDEEYHLLSVLPPSSLMFQMTEKIEKASRHARSCRDKKSEQYKESYCFVPDLTRTAFGGTKPQNISCLNNPLGTDVLLSIPPELDNPSLRIPKKNFFFESLYWRSFQEDLQALHQIFVGEQNNRFIREKRNRILQSIVWKIWHAADPLQDLPAGWSEKTDLPDEQKIWLDAGRYEAHQKDGAWIQKIGQEFARWLYTLYRKQKDAVALGSAERGNFASVMEEALQQEVRGEP